MFDVLGLLGQAQVALAAAMAGPLAGYLLTTGRLAGDPALQDVYRTALACLAALLVVPVGLRGIAIVVRRPVPAVTVSQLLTIGTAVAALPVTGLEIGLANRLVAVMLPNAAQVWNRLIAVPAAPGADLAGLVAGVVVTALLVVVAVLALARWATLWLLIALAPIVAAFALLPGADRLTRTWWRLQLAAVFLPVGQATALAAYLAMFARASSPIVGAFAGVAVLVLVAKLPGWAAGSAVGPEVRDFTLRLRGAYVTSRAAREVLSR